MSIIYKINILVEKKLFLRIFAVIIITGCSEIGTSTLDAPTVINISDFGGIANDGKDDTPALRASLEKIGKIRNRISLHFPPGTYDFFSKSAFRVNYPVTAVHKQWDFVTPFHLNGLENLTIDGGGSTFVMHGRMTPFVLNDCKNITVTGLSIKNERPSVFELKVISRESNVVEFEVTGNDKFVIENNNLIWLDADDKRQVPNVFQFYDPVKDITRRCPNPLKDATLITKVSNERIFAEYNTGSGLIRKIHLGDVFQFRYGIRNQSGIVVYESQKISFENLNVYSWNGLGFVCQFCRDLSFKNLRMEPDPASGRTNAGFADAIQILAGQGEILIENSRFAGLHDDHINIYGQMMKVTKVNGQREVEAIFTSGETEGFLNFRKGDEVIFRNPKTLEAKGGFKVTDSKLPDEKTLIITLDKDVLTEYQDYWIENLTRIPDKVIIRGNYFGRVPTRSILMFVARESIIENNTFHRIPMNAILMQCPDQRWALQNHVGKLIIRNNVFYECESTLIKSNPQVQVLSENAGLYGNLEVLDNLVIMREEMPFFIDIRGFSCVIIGTNRIELAEPHKKLAIFENCKEVNLSSQMILGVEVVPKVEMKDVYNYAVEEWKIEGGSNKDVP